MDEVISFPLLGDLTLNPPRSLNIFGFPIYYYGLIIAAGYILAALYAHRRRRDFGLSSDNILDLVLCIVIFGILGARLYYIIFNAKDYFSDGNWTEIFNIRNGGLAIYGGLIAGSASILVYCKRKKLGFLKTFDMLGIAVPIGQAVGRWGNFINREAYGTETNVPWKMGLTGADGVTRYVHPTFLYESLWNIIGVIALHIYSKKSKHRKDGEIIFLYTAWYGLGRFFIESLRTDSLYLGNMRISQIVAAVTFFAAIAALAAVKKRGKPALAEDTESLDALNETEVENAAEITNLSHDNAEENTEEFNEAAAEDNESSDDITVNPPEKE